MKYIYIEMILLNEVMLPLVEIQTKSQEILKVLKVACIFVDLIQDWDTKYLNIIERLVSKDILVADLEK